MTPDSFKAALKKRPLLLRQHGNVMSFIYAVDTTGKVFVMIVMCVHVDVSEKRLDAHTTVPIYLKNENVNMYWWFLLLENRI